MFNIVKLLSVSFFLTISLSFQTVEAQKGYWQQDLNYKINVELNDYANLLIADMQLEYVNNSPTELKEIYFHIWPQAFSTDSSAYAIQELENRNLAFRKRKEKDLGALTGLAFTINGKAVPFKNYNNQVDIIILQLNIPLKSGEKLLIKTPFQVKIPASFSRLGHVGESFQITQWYPKPAVYDKNGWHPIPYLTQGEFYSEFGSFDVSITLPENYVVGATGDLQTESEKDFLNQKIKETEGIIDFGKNLDFPKSASKKKTIRYTQNNVHDFAWFADKRFHVLRGFVKLPNSEDSVICYSMFTNKYAKEWKKSLIYLQDAIYYYSLWNGNYPYKQVTAVDGTISAGGGMEYPNVTIIGPAGSDKLLETVIMHEVGHNWFYGILGSNERDFPWMDEGINTFYEKRYLATKHPDAKLVGKFSETGTARLLDIENYPSGYENYLLYLLNATKNEDQAIGSASTEFTQLNYAGIAYGKTGLAFEYLRTYLGTEVFDKAMKSYFEEWKFKHPQPEDIKNVFAQSTGKNLDWFFDDLLKTNKKLDFTIKKVKKNSENIEVSVQSKSDIPAPVFVSGLNDKGEVVESKTIEPFLGNTAISFSKPTIKSIKIDAFNKIPEINQKNNFSRVSGLFKKTEQIKLQLFGSIPNRDKNQLFIAPAIGYNFNDGLMAGLVLYNSLAITKKFEYEIVPLYGFKSKQLNGTGRLAYNWFPQKTFQRITLSSNYNQFTYFTNEGFIIKSDSGIVGQNVETKDLQFRKIQGKIEFELKRNSLRNAKKSFISARLVSVNKSILNTDLALFKYDNTNDLFSEINFRTLNNRVINPYSYYINVQQHDDFVKAEAEFNFSFSYKKKNKSADIRIFAGQFIYENKLQNASQYYFSFNGNNDYLYDQVFLDRSKVSEDFLNRQLSDNDGGFRNLTTAAPAKQMLSINAKVPLPISLPIGFYADAGISSYVDNFNNGNRGFYDVGIYVPIMKNVLEVYFPIFISSDLNQLNYGQKISFVFNIKSLNPLTAAKNFNL